MSKLFVIGDIHGQFDKMVSLLQSKNLINSKLNWIGEDATLVFTGDFFDRGPDGIGCLNLVMRLQWEAACVGGRVFALLGNHEVMLLAAYRFGTILFDGMQTTFWQYWQRNGGINRDFEKLTSVHLEWLSSLPAMLKIDDFLFVHSDSKRYEEFGYSVEAVNQNVQTVLNSDLAWAWNHLLNALCSRHSFSSHTRTGVQLAREFLDLFGGLQIVHGHTPLNSFLDEHEHDLNSPYVYAEGLCINVDGGMCMEGDGFICELPLKSAAPQLEEQYYIQFPEEVAVVTPLQLEMAF